MKDIREIAGELRRRGVASLTFVRGKEIVDMADGGLGRVGVQLRGGELLVLDELAISLIAARHRAAKLVPEPAPEVTRAAALRANESEPGERRD